jgi:DNA-directed RNA polymerase subunit F
MIHEKDALSLSESIEFVNKEKRADFLAFAKKFIQLNPKEAKELKEKIVEMQLIKIRDSHIAKIIDVLPKDKEDLLKIVTDVDLNEEEINSILSLIKEYI